MEPIIIEGTNITPKVLFDPSANTFEISGESRPENVKDFYEPILKWLENYRTELSVKSNKEPFTVKMFLEYFNSSSAKYILNLTKKLYEYINAGIPVSIKWCYIEDDEDMKETGEEMQSLSKVPFEFVVIQ
jgi:hypothetical protein